MSTTLLALKRLIAKCPGLGYDSGTCSAAGTTLTVIDTSGDSPMDPDDRNTLFENAWVEIESDSAGTPLNVGEIRRVTDYVPSISTLTVSRALSNATTTTQSYGIYMGVPPTRQGMEKGIDEYVNDVLNTMRYRCPTLLTLAPDGDMEASGTTNWSQVGTATFAKGTTGVTLGKQAMSVLATVTNSGISCTNILVTEGQVYDVVVDCKQASDTQTLTMAVYDETNGVVIDSVSTMERAQRYLYLQVTIPDDCTQIEVRLTDTGTGADYAYYDNLSVRHAHAKEMALPSWFDPQTCTFEELWAVGGGQQETDDDSYSVDERDWHRVHSWEILEDRGGVTPYKVHFEELIPSGYHLVAQILRPYGELSADTDTTDAEPNAVKCFALANIWQDKQDEKKAQFWAKRAHNLYQGPRPQIRGAKPLRGF